MRPPVNFPSGMRPLLLTLWRLPRYLHFAIPIVGIVSIVVLRSFAPTVILDNQPFMLFMVVVAASALAGGLWPGLIASGAALIIETSHLVHSNPGVPSSAVFVNVGAAGITMLILTILGHLVRREALTSEATLTNFRNESAGLGFLPDSRHDGLPTVDRQNSALLEFERDARQRAEEAVRTKDDFLLTISHELRTPLTTILGWLEITQADPSSATYERAREAIERSARTQEKLVGQLLDLASFSSGRLALSGEIFDLNEAAAMSIRNLEFDRAARNHELQHAPWPGPLLVRGDQDQIVKVIEAILENAFLYTASPGQIKFRTIASGSSAIIEIEDSGKGIDQKYLPDLFDRFRRNERTVSRRYTGLGLGLTIARAIVDLHGGVIEAASAGPGMGSTFRVRLPLSAVSAPAALGSLSSRTR